MACVLPFLSCLRGSELGKKFPNPLILKELSPPAGEHPKLRGICQAVDLQGSLQAARKRVRTREQQFPGDRKSTRLNSSHSQISYAVFCLKKKKTKIK